jgi:hypothetical protein
VKKFAAVRPFADPNAAARKIVQIAKVFALMCDNSVTKNCACILRGPDGPANQP